MKVLFYRYGSICEPDIYSYFSALGITVISEDTDSFDIQYPSAPHVRRINELITTHAPLFVFTINYFPIIAEICHIHNTLYLCWSVDCPLIELFDPTIQYSTNRIFLFDKKQYNYFYPFNPNCIFYLPLAANVERFNHTIQNITEYDKIKYTSDISFIGSLYSEKDPIVKLNNISPYALGYIEAITNTYFQCNDYSFVEDSLSDCFVTEFKKTGIILPTKSIDADYEKYIIAHRYLGYHLTSLERIKTLDILSKYFDVDLYTGSSITALPNIRTHSPISSLHDMPKAFNLSKININMTMKPIKSGLPLRIFDIMGCGGFLITNHQAELTDFFEIGKDLESYNSLDELIEKCHYYLHHEKERQQIAYHGYQTICEYHTYPHRLNEMIKIVLSSLAQ